MTTQLAIRLADDLVADLDDLVTAGRFANRTEVVRSALHSLIETERRRQIDDAIRDGYRRVPPTEAECRWADAAGRDMIAEEPW